MRIKISTRLLYFPVKIYFPKRRYRIRNFIITLATSQIYRFYVSLSPNSRDVLAKYSLPLS